MNFIQGTQIIISIIISGIIINNLRMFPLKTIA